MYLMVGNYCHFEIQDGVPSGVKICLKFQGHVDLWYQNIEDPHFFSGPYLVVLISFTHHALK